MCGAGTSLDRVKMRHRRAGMRQGSLAPSCDWPTGCGGPQTPKAETMPFASANFPVLALLTELHIDCLEAERGIKKLRTGCRHWRLVYSGRKAFDRTFT